MSNKKSAKKETLGSDDKKKKTATDKAEPELEEAPSGKSDEPFSPRFPIAGVGASAGGLEAFTELLSHLPGDTGMGFVLVQHLHPEYPSALTEILSRATSMPVIEIEDGMRVEPNHIYIIPPNTYLGIMHGILHLMPRSDVKGQNLPIDYFFRHLAEDLDSMAIGIILSGTASDGVQGLKAISAAGGITIAQDRESAKYDGMPHSAIAAGCVDVVLPPDKIAVELSRIAHHPYVTPRPAGKAAEALPLGDDMLSKIFLLLRRQTGNDFTYYKPTTIQRRIRRRMLLHKLDRLGDYVRYLQETPAEIDQLFHDLLINVTEFFRDPDTFEALAAKVFPALKDRSADTPVRIWVPGCATGEEPYSLAIALLEYLGDSAGNVAIQIFATDIDENAIAVARAGLYPENISQQVSPERLRRFFVRVEGGRYQISKYIREMCIYAVQNVIKDPPFSRLDLISCRNLLIYLGPVLQKKIMGMFHYALKPGGYLLLGSAESIGGFSDYYQAVDSKEKIYSKKSVATPLQMDFGTYGGAVPPPPPQKHESGILRIGADFDLNREVDQLLMHKFTPPAVVINSDMDILQFRGRTGAYLESPPGEATLKILKMAREDIMLELNSVVRKALGTGEPAHKDGIRIQREGKQQMLNIEVLPINARGLAEQFFVVTFETATSAAKAPPYRPKTQAAEEGLDHARVTELEQELAATKEYLQSVIEQQESSNEELRSANEEIQSSNEELQSINEELETAKEELQSTNEELATVNEELGNRNRELDQSNNDLNNLITSMNIPLVILGLDQRVRRFSPQAEKLLKLISGDIGRPFSDIKTNINVEGLRETINQVIETLHPVEREAQDDDGHWYSVRVRPYKTLDNKIDGAVVVFISIDEMKRSLDAARRARNYAEAVIAALRDPILVLDKRLAVVSASNAFCDTFQVSSEETIGNLLYRLGNSQWGIPELRRELDKTITMGEPFDGFIVEHDFEKIGRRTMSVSGRPIPASDSSEVMVLMQIEDIT